MFATVYVRWAQLRNLVGETEAFAKYSLLNKKKQPRGGLFYLLLAGQLLFFFLPLLLVFVGRLGHSGLQENGRWSCWSDKQVGSVLVY